MEKESKKKKCKKKIAKGGASYNPLLIIRRRDDTDDTVSEMLIMALSRDQLSNESGRLRDNRCIHTTSFCSMQAGRKYRLQRFSDQ